MEAFARIHDQRFDRVPDADAVNRTTSPERLEESAGDALVVLGVVDLRRVLDQVVLARAQQPALEDHPGEGTRREGPSTESEQVDAITLLVVVCEETVGVLHVLLQAVAGGLVSHRAQLPALLVVLPAAGAHAGIVVGDLAFILVEREIGFDDVGVVLAELVTGAVAAYGDVLHGCSQVPGSGLTKDNLGRCCGIDQGARNCPQNSRTDRGKRPFRPGLSTRRVGFTTKQRRSVS